MEYTVLSVLHYLQVQVPEQYIQVLHVKVPDVKLWQLLRLSCSRCQCPEQRILPAPRYRSALLWQPGIHQAKRHVLRLPLLLHNHQVKGQKVRPLYA